MLSIHRSIHRDAQYTHGLATDLFCVTKPGNPSTSIACTLVTTGTSTTRRTTTTTTRLRKPCRGTSSTCFTPTSSTNQKRPRFPSCRMARNTAKRVFCESARGRRTKVRVLRLSQIPDDCHCVPIHVLRREHYLRGLSARIYCLLHTSQVHCLPIHGTCTLKTDPFGTHPKTSRLKS